MTGLVAVTTTTSLGGVAGATLLWALLARDA